MADPKLLIMSHENNLIDYFDSAKYIPGVRKYL